MIELNKIYNEDCMITMGNIDSSSVDLILSDPPYGMNYVSSWRKEKFNKIVNDTELDWVEDFCKESYRILKDNSHIYLFCNDYSIGKFRNSLQRAGFNVKRTLVWVKNNHTSGDLYGDYANKTEFIVFAHKGRKELNGSRDTNILNYDRVSVMSHPTEKPVSINQYLIQKSTNESDVVYDPFIGSGTTARAAKNLSRKYLGSELDKKYYQIALNRLRQETLF